MSTNSNDRTKKSRQNKKLKQLNIELKTNDILRGEKQTSKRDEVLLRENLRLKDNEPRTRFKSYVSKLIRYHFQDADNCFFFSLCYPYKDKTGMVANITIMETLKAHLLSIGAVESMITIPEYHKTRSAIHNHGIISLKESFTGDFNMELQKIWVQSYHGSVFVTLLNASKRFETYLTKFVEADESRLYNFSDGLLMVGINLNEVAAIRVAKPTLIPVKPDSYFNAYADLESTNEDTDESIITTNFHADTLNLGGSITSDGIVTSEIPKSGVLMACDSPNNGNCELFKFSNIIHHASNKSLKMGFKSTKEAAQRMYRWCAILVVTYLHFLMRI